MQGLVALRNALREFFAALGRAWSQIWFQSAPTTPLELDQNYSAVCNVEPEQMDQAASDFGQSAEKLLILQKARGIEGHKGGAVVKQGTPGDDCILGWLRGDPLLTVSPRCQSALDGLP